MVSPIRAYLSPTPRQLRILLHIPLLCIEFVEMGGGAAQRRRIKNFEKANVSLHKAAVSSYIHNGIICTDTKRLMATAGAHCWVAALSHCALPPLCLCCCCWWLQQGKGKTSMPLPAAPTKDDYRDKMPASLRKMLALKVD